MARKPIGILGASTLFAAALAASTAFSQETPVAKPQQNLPAIVVTTAVNRTLVDRVIGTGTVKPVEEVYIQPQVEGLSIRTLKADVGDKVQAESTLATLNEDALVLEKSQMMATRAKGEASLAQLRAQLIEAQANAEQARQQQARAQEMVKKGTVSTAQVEQADATAAAANARVVSAEQAIEVAEADLKVFDSQIADADLKLARTDVKTPVGGTISAKNAKVGAIAAGTSDPMFTLIRNGDIELVAEIAESDIVRVMAGQKATISLSGSRERLSGAVRLVSPTVDPVTRLGLVHISIDDDSKARSGMYGSAEIIVRETEGVALPLTAVLTGNEGSSARKVEDGVVKFAKIETGIQDGAYVEIIEGLKTGDEVVAKAGAYVRDGDHITPVREQPPASN
ncbi:efflux RND transporter periplasmic adaptor subunit [Rhizobium laguerreae]|uniref:efflux RND transporter periplasmic adaptor subunit n=1 Tax=Rhizobium laguerreae TaxID=1076926 RepID=UPI001C90A1F7|nr:efflux RND transporter periplasmic adaptor subunit [Rhizobium laguerreae]MBY3365625.1 efflux RND transporter periplasmic adaptor subunit [Rhizobium laguerreae]MBY3390033.1 efflux RND transporter periplasmic adaptor subunit [Rhizobium laguerreae]MBY3400285.1 efflux RND transporter periplasmic adaptor subunit [Rhizobium laguerreae]MBY3407223.1 efflux RND transporter periplasmic adaptor subunit [Rhizobium laguerreae]MBY3515244.1 efflux RND transporter periplasmic adaptor subunit [Rhizobium lag